jgi:hypothetical protein
MKKLQECKTLHEAASILKRATPTQKMVIETAFALKTHENPAQRAIGENFWQTAIREMDDSEQPAMKHDDGIKPKKEHFVKEADLADGNKSGTEGSEQSSKNSGPTEKEGTTEPEGDMEDPGMSTENQMTEAFPPMPGQGMPPQMPPQQPGLDPALVQQMGQGMPQLPPMNTPQQIQQMQYTIKEYLRPIYARMAKQETVIKYQNKAIKDLNTKVTETVSLKTGLDLAGFKERSILPGKVQETMPSSVSNIDTEKVKIFEKPYQLQKKRSEITEMNNLLSAGKAPYQ